MGRSSTTSWTECWVIRSLACRLVGLPGTVVRLATSRLSAPPRPRIASRRDRSPSQELDSSPIDSSVSRRACSHLAASRKRRVPVDSPCSPLSPSRPRCSIATIDSRSSRSDRRWPRADPVATTGAGGERSPSSPRKASDRPSCGFSGDSELPGWPFDRMAVGFSDCTLHSSVAVGLACEHGGEPSLPAHGMPSHRRDARTDRATPTGAMTTPPHRPDAPPPLAARRPVRTSPTRVGDASLPHKRAPSLACSRHLRPPPPRACSTPDWLLVRLARRGEGPTKPPHPLACCWVRNLLDLPILPSRRPMTPKRQATYDRCLLG